MKFLGSPFIGGMRGSMGGITASANGSGAYLKMKSIPTNPNSPRQQAARNNFQALAVIWSDILTQIQRDAWAVYAFNIVFKDSLGQSYKIKGYNMFMRSNLAVLSGGLTRVDDGPTIFTLPTSDPALVATASEATQLLTIEFDPLEQWVNEDDAGLSIFMTIPRGLGREYLVGHQRLAGTLLGDVATPLTSPQTLAVPFPVAEDQKILVSAEVILADGRVSNPFQDTDVVAA